MANEADRGKLATICRAEPLSRIVELSEDVLAGRVRGRIVIDVNQ